MRFLLRTLTHVNFNHVNQIEVRHSIEIKRQIKRVSTYFEAYIIVRAAFHTLPLFYLRTQVLRTCARKNYVTVDTSYLEYL